MPFTTQRQINKAVIRKRQSLQKTTQNTISSTHQSCPAEIIQRAKQNPGSLALQDVKYLQRTIGNHATGRLFREVAHDARAIGLHATVQTKDPVALPQQQILEEAKRKRVGADSEEEEEKRKAATVLRKEGSSLIQRECIAPSSIRGASYTPAASVGKYPPTHALTHMLHEPEHAFKMTHPAIQRTIGDGHDLTSARFSGNAVLEAVFDNERTLKKGNSGKAVELVQQTLVDLSYDLPDSGVDGDFGKETEAAIRAFQMDTGATVDGKVGRQTIGFLDSRVQGQPVVAPPAPVIGNALPSANVIVQPGAPPVNGGPLGACDYGLTDTETVTINIDAVRSGANWVPVVNGLIGNYSLQYRILPTQTEVTGPGGNTTAANFCAQVTELNALGNCGATARWYMQSAVLAHERVHATRLRPALVTSAPAIEASVEALSVPHIPGMNAAAAAVAIRALPAFAAAVANARTVWDAAYVALITGDHAAGGQTDAAEHGIVDPMIQRICGHAKAHKWGACSPPC